MVSETTATVAVFIIPYILSCTVPAEILLLRLPLGVNNYFHSHPIQVILLVLIENFEPGPLSLSGVGHSKEKPLRISIGVGVVLKKQ